MKKNQTLATALIVTTALLGGCADMGYPSSQASQPYPASAPSYSTGYGVVDSIQMVNANNGNGGIGAGTIIGGVVGGVLGNLVGGGTGNKIATGAGAVGGALIGNQMDRNRTQAPTYQIGIRLDNGGYQTVTQDNVSDLSVGARVRIDNGRAYRN